MSDIEIPRFWPEMLGDERKEKNNRALEEASEGGKTFIFLVFWRMRRPVNMDHKWGRALGGGWVGGARIPGMREWGKVLRFRIVWDGIEFRDGLLGFIQEEGYPFLCK